MVSVPFIMFKLAVMSAAEGLTFLEIAMVLPYSDFIIASAIFLTASSVALFVP